jgi:hypothetical protein
MRSAPGWVLGNHAENDLTQFRTDSLPPQTSTIPREPGQTRSESRTMPSHNRLRLDENQRMLPSTLDTPQHHREQSVRSRKSRLQISLLQDCKLLSKRQILQKENSTRSTELDDWHRQNTKQTQRRPSPHSYRPSWKSLSSS